MSRWQELRRRTWWSQPSGWFRRSISWFISLLLLFLYFVADSLNTLTYSFAQWGSPSTFIVYLFQLSFLFSSSYLLGSLSRWIGLQRINIVVRYLDLEIGYLRLLRLSIRKATKWHLIADWTHLCSVVHFLDLCWLMVLVHISIISKTYDSLLRLTLLLVLVNSWLKEWIERNLWWFVVLLFFNMILILEILRFARLQILFFRIWNPDTLTSWVTYLINWFLIFANQWLISVLSKHLWPSFDSKLFL